MQKTLQINKNSQLRKQASKLSLQLKFSDINSTWHELLVNSPKTKKSSNRSSVRSFRFNSIGQDETSFHQEMLLDNIEYLERSLQKLMSKVQYQKRKIKQNLQQFQIQAIKKQQTMKQLTLNRYLQIQNLKKQMNLIFSLQKQQRQQFFLRLQAQFNQRMVSIQRTYKQIKRQWKNQLRSIIAKIQHNDEKEQTAQTQNVNIKRYSLQILQIQISKANFEYNEKTKKIQLQMAQTINKFTQQQKRFSKKFDSQFLEVSNAISKLEKTLKQQVQKEKYQSEQNRQRILLLFEQSVEKIQKRKQQTKLKQKKKNTYQYGSQVQYRYLK